MSYGGHTRKKGSRRAYLKAICGQRVKVSGNIDRLSEHSLASRSQAAKNTDPIPPTLGVNTLRPINQESFEVVRVRKYLNLQDIWQGNFHQGSIKYHSYTVYEGKITTLRLFFHGCEAFFIEEHRIGRYLRKSIGYSSTDTARKRHADGQVKFHPERIPL